MESMTERSGFYCNMMALSPVERANHKKLTDKLADRYCLSKTRVSFPLPLKTFVSTLPSGDTVDVTSETKLSFHVPVKSVAITFPAESVSTNRASDVTAVSLLIGELPSCSD